MTVNDTTNSLTTKIIFGNEKHPKLVYTNLEETFPGYKFVKEWNPVIQRYEKHKNILHLESHQKYERNEKTLLF